MKPPVQRFGAALLLQDRAVVETAYLVQLGLRYRTRVDGTPPSQAHLALVREFNAAAADAVGSASPTADVREAGGLSDSEESGWVKTEAAARMLGMSTRQVRRMAGEFDGRLVNGSWLLPRAAVSAAAERRQKGRARDG